MSTTFRVEAFIVPSLNRDKTCENIIDDVKVANKLREIDFPRGLECINEESECSDNSILERSIEIDENADENNFNNSPVIKINLVAPEEDQKSREIIQSLPNSIIRTLPMIKIDFVDSTEETSQNKISQEPIYDVPFSAKRKLESQISTEKLPNDKLASSEVDKQLEGSPTPPLGPPVSFSSPATSDQAEKPAATVVVLTEPKKMETNFLKIEFSPSDDSGSHDEPQEPIYDVPYSCAQRRKPYPVKLVKNLESGEFVSSGRNGKFRGPKIPLPRPLARSSSLMSIDERGETPDDCVDQFCCHGFKNGCTAATQRPEELTEEVFEINWMKRLENLRAREAVIREKEAALFDRERLLFKKEKELRILERLVKDKLKHAELCSRRIKHHTNSGSADTLHKGSEGSEGSKESLGRQLSSIESLECKFEKIGPIKEKINATRNLIFNDKITSAKTLNILNDKITSGKCLGGLNDKGGAEGIKAADSAPFGSSAEPKLPKNPPNSRSSLVSTLPERKANAPGLTHHGRTTSVGYSGYSSIRRKRKPRVSYDDLDSTLSADVGDSSYVVTSKKFDPVVFKKPQAFTRCASERRPQIEEEKVLKRISENIFVSQDKDTKFLDYGLIDLGAEDVQKTEGEDKRCSYLDLESGKTAKSKARKEAKERPVSWNEESNEWLQKKRMAYNCSVKRIPTQDFDNKENARGKKKGKKFSIFR